MSHHAPCVVLLLLCSASPVPLRAANPQSPAVPLVLHMDGRISLTVLLNGAGPFRFRLDTGASRTVVAADVADRLRLPDAGTSRVLTHTGSTTGTLVQVHDLRLAAGLPPSGPLAAVARRVDLDHTGETDGLLGQDVLSERPYSIDYRTRRLVLSPASPGAAAVRLPLHHVEGGLVVHVPRPRQAPLRLVPDSGADRLVLFGGTGGPLPPFAAVRPVRVRSVTGARAARLVRVYGLELGAIRLPDQDGVLMDAESTSGALGDGLLPLHLFGRVTFNVAEGYLALEPRL